MNMNMMMTKTHEVRNVILNVDVRSICVCVYLFWDTVYVRSWIQKSNHHHHHHSWVCTVPHSIYPPKLWKVRTRFEWRREREVQDLIYGLVWSMFIFDSRTSSSSLRRQIPIKPHHRRGWEEEMRHKSQKRVWCTYIPEVLERRWRWWWDCWVTVSISIFMWSWYER